MLYLTCTTITRVDLAHYGVPRAKDRVSVDCGTNVKGGMDVLHQLHGHFLNCYFQRNTIELYIRK